MENPMILLLYLFESFLIITLGGVLFGYSSSQDLKAYLKIGIALGLVNFIMRNAVLAFDLPVLTHVPFTFALTVILVKKLAKFEWILAGLISIVGFFSALLNEMIFGTLYIKLLNIKPELVVASTFEHLKIGILVDLTFVFLIPIIYLIKNKNKKGNFNSAEKISSIIK